MTYATRTDMTARFAEDELIQLTDRDRLGQIDNVVLDRALADADAEINGYLAAAMTLPVPLIAVPLVIKRLACDIARYYLYDGHVTEQVRARYQDGIKLLKLVSEKKVSLGLDTVNAPVASLSGVSYKSPGRVFNADTLKDY